MPPNDGFGEAAQPEPLPGKGRFPSAIKQGSTFMADGNGGGGNSALALLVGALLVIVLIGGFFIYGGNVFNGGGGTTHTVNLNVKTPAKGG